MHHHVFKTSLWTRRKDRMELVCKCTAYFSTSMIRGHKEKCAVPHLVLKVTLRANHPQGLEGFYLVLLRYTGQWASWPLQKESCAFRLSSSFPSSHCIPLGAGRVPQHSSEILTAPHTIAEWVGLEGPTGCHLVLPPLPQQGPLEPVIQKCLQTSEYLD